MKKFTALFLVLSLFTLCGCETVKKGTTAGGEAIGKGADALGGITEGATEGYAGPDAANEENPYGR